jgi:hypothetical protein
MMRQKLINACNTVGTRLDRVRNSLIVGPTRWMVAQGRSNRVPTVFRVLYVLEFLHVLHVLASCLKTRIASNNID